MVTKLETGLSLFIILIAASFFAQVAVQNELRFSPEQMAVPGIVLAFISACTVNLARLAIGDRRLDALSVVLNALTFSYALGLALQDPHAGKILTTSLMAMATLLSATTFFKHRDR